jgi:hypothetical protein
VQLQSQYHEELRQQIAKSRRLTRANGGEILRCATLSKYCLFTILRAETMKPQSSIIKF